MANEKEDKKNKPEKLTDKDNPSLIEVGGNIRLRVIEDFYIEKELPKWKHFQEMWKKVKEDLGLGDYATEDDIFRKVRVMEGKTESEKGEITKQVKNLLAMNKAFQDDRYHIQEKHEREFDAAIMKQAKFVLGLSRWQKIRNAMFPFGKKAMPVEVAMDDLREHIELTSTEALAEQLGKLKVIEDNMRKAGQYKKADMVKQYRGIISEEEVVCAAGFTSYITEENMIDFIRKAERGTTVDYLRYYEDEIPQEVIEKKVAADKLMVFDNYVVAHYTDLIHKAVKTQKKVSAKEEDKQRKRRRDPILFGIVKNSRKLYYICDWITDTDDLTLEKIEKEIGVTRSSLLGGASTATLDTAVDQSGGNSSFVTNNIRNYIRETVQDEVDGALYDSSLNNGRTWSIYSNPYSTM